MQRKAQKAHSTNNFRQERHSKCFTAFNQLQELDAILKLGRTQSSTRLGNEDIMGDSRHVAHSAREARERKE